MRSIKWFLALALAFGLALGSLASAQDRMGAWVDEIVIVEEPSTDAAITQLKVGALDVYAFTVADPAVRRTVAADADLKFYESYGSYNELSFNPCGPTFDDGRLNPFSVPRVREAMNWLIDREFISQEVTGGAGVPRYHAFASVFAEGARYADIARAIELLYAPDKDRAEAVIAEEMEALGATKVGGVWSYNGAPVVINVLIRIEDERRLIGDYVANQLEDVGFTVDRLIRTSAEASPLWISADPCEGRMHVYTGGWISTAVPRTEADNFQFFYTDRGLASPLWQAYVNAPEFGELADQLAESRYSSLEERRELFAQILPLAMQDSHRIWVSGRVSISPLRANVSVAADLAGAIAGSPLWPYTIRRDGEVGGSLYVGMPSVLTQPWNPLDGSNWIYDAALYRATGDLGVITDPFTGINRPQRIESAEVVVREGLPVGTTYDWVDFSFAPTIPVPADAWADWDAVDQRWITVGEKYPDGVTAERMSRVTYPADLYTSVMWHDGSPFSAADVVLSMILSFDRGKEGSFVFDEAQVPAVNTFLNTHRGVRIVSVDPLVIETYSDFWSLDAENNVTSWWPQYARGPGAWHNLAIGLLADSEGAATFGSNKANQLEVEHLSMIAGPTIEILDGYLAQAQSASFVPYASALAPYLGADEVATRYANLAAWRQARGHFWIGTGPFYLDRAFPIESTVVLKRNADFPDAADKWAGFGAARIADVDVDGPARVEIGSDATFEVFVSFEDQPYPSADIGDVKFLVLDATGSLAGTGDAVLVGEGIYEVTLPAELTGALEVGSNRLEVSVAPLVVSIPSFASAEFVTTR